MNEDRPKSYTETVRADLLQEGDYIELYPWGVVQVRGVVITQTMVHFRVVGKDSLMSVRADRVMTVHV